MSTYSAVLWTVIFPPHPPYPQPSFACRWPGRFLCRLLFAPFPRASRPVWRAAWKTRSGASTRLPHASAWPSGETPGPARGTGTWQSCAPATGHRASSQTRRMPGDSGEGATAMKWQQWQNVADSWRGASPAWRPPAPPGWQSLRLSASPLHSLGSRIHRAGSPWTSAPAPHPEWPALHSDAWLGRKTFRLLKRWESLFKAT